MVRPLSKVLWLLVLVAIVPAAAYAQGSIAGTVKDTSGAVLPGVKHFLASEDRHGQAG